MENQINSFKKEFNREISDCTQNIYRELQECLRFIGLNPDFHVEPQGFNLGYLKMD